MKALQVRYAQQEVLIEGPELSCDYSFYLVDMCEELREVEKGISITHFKSLDLKGEAHHDDEG